MWCLAFFCHHLCCVSVAWTWGFNLDEKIASSLSGSFYCVDEGTRNANVTQGHKMTLSNCFFFFLSFSFVIKILCTVSQNWSHKWVPPSSYLQSTTGQHCFTGFSVLSGFPGHLFHIQFQACLSCPYPSCTPSPSLGHIQVSFEREKAASLHLTKSWLVRYSQNFNGWPLLPFPIQQIWHQNNDVTGFASWHPLVFSLKKEVDIKKGSPPNILLIKKW